MIDRTPAKGVVFSLVCLMLLGTMPVIANSRPAVVDALAFAFALSVWQTVFAVPLFVAEMRGPERGVFGMRLSGRLRWRMGLVALGTGALFGLSTYLYVLGVEKAGAATAAIAMQAYPLFAILWESLFLKRRKTAPELMLTLVLVAALYTLGTGGTLRVSGLSPWFLVSLGVPFLWSIAHVIIKEELGRTPVTPVQVTFFRVTISTVFLLILIAVTAPETLGEVVSGALFQVSAVGMGLVYYMELIAWFHAVRHIDVSLASSITTPWPALTMVLAAVALGEAIFPYQIAALVVVGGCVLGLTLAGMRAGRVRQSLPQTPGSSR